MNANKVLDTRQMAKSFMSNEINEREPVYINSRAVKSEVKKGRRRGFVLFTQEVFFVFQTGKKLPILLPQNRTSGPGPARQV